MNAKTKAAMSALNTIIKTIEETVSDAGPLGVPSGHLYAALMGIMSLDTYEKIMAGMVQSGRIVKRGQCYHKA